ncbi:hypothetical protein MKX47_21195 [Solibacillus sp. FSL R7-0668]
MIRKVRNYFFDEDAVATASDKAVIILMALAMGLAIYAAAVVYASTF